MALSGHSNHICECPLLGVKRTWHTACFMSTRPSANCRHSYTLRILRHSPDKSLVPIVMGKRDTHAAAAKSVRATQTVFDLIEIEIPEPRLRNEFCLRLITRQSASFAHDLDAVSYTHLTLPTK